MFLPFEATGDRMGMPRSPKRLRRAASATIKVAPGLASSAMKISSVSASRALLSSFSRMHATSFRWLIDAIEVSRSNLSPAGSNSCSVSARVDLAQLERILPG